MEPIPVVIAEDNEHYYKGLVGVLGSAPGIRLCAAVRDGGALLRALEDITTAVVLTDIQMPVKNGIEVALQLRQRQPGIHIVALTMFSTEHLIVQMLQAGAAGYLDKSVRNEQLLDAVASVYQGYHYHCPTTSQKLAKLIVQSGVRIGHEGVLFSKEEIELVKLVCEEMRNDEIGQRLYYSESKVEKMRKSIQEKMGVKGTAGMILYAVRQGWILL
jgi:DNA-binding NarL/FixJ family response regulator